jgi:hypothetical protein
MLGTHDASATKAGAHRGVRPSTAGAMMYATARRTVVRPRAGNSAPHSRAATAAKADQPTGRRNLSKSAREHMICGVTWC